MEISVIGAGYVGLTTAACLAELGHHVFCAESDVQKLTRLQNGELPFFEPFLPELVDRNRAAGRLEFGATQDAINRGHAIFICVGTPPLESGEADLSAIDGVARSIAKHAAGYRLIIEKSTVPVQTGRQLHRHLALHKSTRLQYDVVSNPEFLREGSAVEDFFHPDRIVVGVEEDRAIEQMREIYRPILDRTVKCPVHASCSSPKQPRFVVTDTNSAELIKHASNSFLAMKISFINMVADLCEAAGADISQVAEGIGLDPRIGAAFLRPGIGFGGFCFPKDLQAFVRIAEKFGCDLRCSRKWSGSTGIASTSLCKRSRRSCGCFAERGWESGEWPLSPTPTMFASRLPFASSGNSCPRALWFRPTIRRRRRRPGRKYQR